MRRAQLKREAFKSDENVFRIEIEEDRDDKEEKEEKKKSGENEGGSIKKDSSKFKEYVPKDFSKQSKDSQDLKDSQNLQDLKDLKNSKDSPDSKDLKDSKDLQDSKDSLDSKDTKASKNSNVLKNSKDSRDSFKGELSLESKLKSNELRNSVRRLTLPVTNIELEQVSLKESLKNLAPPTSPLSFSFFNFNKRESRRPSITNIAIGKTIAPSLAGLFPDSTNFLNHDNIDLRRSLTDSNLSDNNNSSTTSNCLGDATFTDGEKKATSGRRWSRIPFLRGHDDSDRRSHHHLNIPIITFNGPATYGGHGRKFNFGIRRHSHLVSRPEKVLDFGK